jgi:hypothetical protein
MNETLDLDLGHLEVPRNQRSIDSEFGGIVGMMMEGIVELDVDSVKPVVESDKAEKFGAKSFDDAPVNTNVDIEGGMSLEDQMSLKEDVASKFDYDYAARLQEQVKQERRMYDFFQDDDLEGKNKKKDSIWG